MLDLALFENDKKQAMAERDKIKSSILGLVVSEIKGIEMHRDRKGGPMTVDEIESLLRKMVSANVDAIQYYDGDKKNDLLRENEILNTYLDKLPKFLTKAEIRDILIEKEEEIKSHEKKGGAKGIAFRLLKSKDCKVLGEDVNEVVDEMRS